MQLEALYDHGRLTFLTPVRLAQDTFRLLVTVPDLQVLPAGAPEHGSAALDEPADAAPGSLGPFTRALQERLDVVRRAPLAEAEAGSASDLAERARQDGRWEAFALRESC